MKRFNIKYIVFLSLSTIMFSCAELDFEVETGIEVDKPVSVIVNEKLSSYDVLKAYSGDLSLGANASMEDISGASPLITLFESNFDQITATSELNSDSIVSEEGIYDFSLIQSYLDITEQIGISVYGDAIVSNVNQADAYYNTFGSSLTFFTPPFPNKVNASPLNDGTFEGWGMNGNVTVEDYMGYPSIKMVNGATGGNSAATSIQSPVYDVDEGGNYEVTFYLLSNQVGEGRVTFSGLANNEPEMDWMGTGVLTPTFTTKIGWNKISVQTDDFDGSGLFSFKVELGYTENVTYFMNIKGISVVNLNGSVDNPDEIFLECEDAQQIGDYMVLQTDDPANVSGGEMLVCIIDGDIEADDTGGGSPSDPNNEIMQFSYTFTVNTSGTYRFWLRQKAHAGNGNYDSFFMSVDGADYYCPGWPGWGDDSNTSAWTWLRLYTGSNDGYFELEAGEHTASFRIREGGHYFDKMYFTLTENVPTGLGSAAIEMEEITLEVSDDVKYAAVEGALTDYIDNVLMTVGERVNAWTVVKNPFAEDGSILVNGETEVNNEYYWADYLGAEYVGLSFAEAKASVPAETKLFIGETGLVSNTAKLDAVSNALNTISEIDGVAVSVELSLDTDMSEVESMLNDLASTGKLIFITDFKVTISDISEEQFTLQSEVYKSFVELYKATVPTSQQYGISFSEPVSDNTGLWDENYNRKQAYAGFSIGLGASE